MVIINNKKGEKQLIQIVIFLTAIILIFVLANVMAVDWWPKFHHDLNNTGYSTSSVNLTRFGVLWKYQASGVFLQNSPAVVDDLVYIANNDSLLYVLNATNGSIIWNYNLSYLMEDSSYITTSTTAVFENVVYLGDPRGRVFALNATNGSYLWNYTTGDSVAGFPAISNDIIYVGSNDNRLYALNATNGSLIWRSNAMPTDINGCPLVVEDRVYFHTTNGYLIVLNATNGTSIQEVGGFGTLSRISPSFDNGTIYTSSSGAFALALNSSNVSQQIWNYSNSMYGFSGALIFNGVSYFGGGAAQFLALNASNGSFIWNASFGISNTVAGYAVSNNLAFVGTGGNVGIDDNHFYAFNATNGSRLWNYTTGGDISSSPAIANGIVYVGSDDNYLYAFTNGVIPVVTLNSPEAVHRNSTGFGLNITFNCSASVDQGTLMNISLYLTNPSNASFALNVSTPVTGLSNTTNWTLELRPGNYTWNCLGGANVENIAFGDVNRSIQINATIGSPYFKDSTPVNQTYTFGQAVIQQINATDSYGISCFTVNNSDFAINCSGHLANATVLGAAVYWLNVSVNDTANNLNYSSFWINITQAKQSITPLLNGVNANLVVTYSQQVNASYTGTNYTDLNITINGTQVSHGVNYTWGAVGWTVNFSMPGNQNYSGNETFLNLTVNRASGAVYTYINHLRANKTMRNDTLNVYLNASLVNGSEYFQLYRNTSLINNGTTPIYNLSNFTVPNVYNITAIYPGNQNYTAASETWWLNSSSDYIPPQVTIKSPNASVTYTSTDILFNITTDENSRCNFTVNAGLVNYSMTANSSSTGFNYTKSMSTGTYTANFSCWDEVNNLNNTENVTFTVCIPSSACAATTCTGSTCSSCGTTYAGTKDCSNPGGGGGGGIPPVPCKSECTLGEVTGTCANTGLIQQKVCVKSGACSVWSEQTDSCSGSQYCSGGKCIPNDKCIPNWACGSWSSCVEKQQSRTCTESKCNQNEKVEIKNCDCTESWKCSWTTCAEGDSSSYPYDCVDMNNCWTTGNKPEPVACDEITPELETEMGITGMVVGGGAGCSKWGECFANYDLKLVLTGNFVSEGIQKRVCKFPDGKNSVEARPCNLTLPVRMTPKEKCFENYLEVYNLITGNVVGKIKESSFGEYNFTGIDIIYPLSEFTGYCDYCYDEIKNYDEEGVDCGGPNCPPCFEKKGFFNWLFWLLVILWAGFFGLFFSLMKEIKLDREYMKDIENVFKETKTEKGWQKKFLEIFRRH